MITALDTIDDVLVPLFLTRKQCHAIGDEWSGVHVETNRRVCKGLEYTLTWRKVASPMP